VAAAFVQKFQLRQAYVADLDAIGGADLSWDAYAEIGQHGLQLWLDAAIADRGRGIAVTSWTGAGSPIQPILGLETLPSIIRLVEVLDAVGPQRLVVSLDMLAGRIWTRVPQWQDSRPLDVARELLRLGVQRLILLDVSRVGSGNGPGTVELLRDLRAQNAHAQIVCGGGIAGWDQIETLGRAGCSGVLIATAFHTGQIGEGEVRRAERIGMDSERSRDG
jgi:phosphoribosylformimino-5-aminoimidazole carboxamide ribotide isomerase